ncbi:sensor histidine kinase [Clostridium oceanicum]|uniref:Sensor histidine kinase n=1 Tax=Clostridium oceanicum TaxID=1543 RepID=A0ABN1J8S7_9CLOT
MYLASIITAISTSFCMCFNAYMLNLVKISLKKTVIYSIIGSGLVFASINLNEKLILPTIIIFLLIALIINNKNFIRSIVTVTISITVISVLNVFIGVVLALTYRVDLDIINNIILKNIHICIIMWLFTYFIGILLSKFIGEMYKKYKIIQGKARNHKEIKTLVLINSLITIILVYAHTNILIEIKSKNLILIMTSLIFLSYLVLNVIITYFFFKNIKKEIEYEYNKDNLKTLKGYVNTIENINNDMRKFKHDYINILSTLNVYIENEDSDGIKSFFYNEVLPFKVNVTEKNQRLGLLKNIKIDALKGVLFSKIMKAYEMNVDLYLDISEEINRISMEYIDLSIIIGNLFDNAIEEAGKCTSPKIKFGIIRKEHSVIIVIINSCREDTPPIYKMFKEGFSTKGEDRGLGLSNIKSIINKKYDNAVLNTYIEKNEFKQELIIKFVEKNK